MALTPEKNGKERFEKESNSEGEATFAFKYRTSDIETIIGTPPLRDFIYVRYLKYIAHVCRRPNSNLTKKELFIKPTAKYVRDPWIKIEKLLNMDKDQETGIFNRLLLKNFNFLKN